VITVLIFYSLLSAAMFYLGSRALVTKYIWSAYPPWFARLMDCSACTGFWWGILWSIWLPPSVIYPEIDGFARGPAIPIVIGLCMIALTPIVAGFMQSGLDMLGQIRLGDDDSNDDG
jgi:hypothetical protein